MPHPAHCREFARVLRFALPFIRPAPPAAFCSKAEKGVGPGNSLIFKEKRMSTCP